MYALLGIGHGNAKASVLGYGKKEEQDSLAYGVGMQFNPLNNIAIDASYEYTKLKDANIGTWVLGIGYRFLIKYFLYNNNSRISSLCGCFFISCKEIHNDKKIESLTRLMNYVF